MIRELGLYYWREAIHSQTMDVFRQIHTRIRSPPSTKTAIRQ